ncbi:hypothetical protein LguiB_009819 [Lonicera macranthoides]
MLLQSTNSPPLQNGSRSSLVIGTISSHKQPICCALSEFHSCGFNTNYEQIIPVKRKLKRHKFSLQIYGRKITMMTPLTSTKLEDAEFPRNLLIDEDITNTKRPLICVSAISCASISWLTLGQVAHASEGVKMDPVYEVGELFELGIQLSYVLLLLGLLGVGTFFVIRQVLVRRELDLSAKELQAKSGPGKQLE